ncbi:hypothetical protein HOU02_gp208 [Caulobacter phage CcrBL9]|uniref:Uncharacterized protein n=1 Tax=Caulobacter phage CcrBL9 TaxID=2283270 RepID=A0A385EFG0_9CAUD|nr:hypothetical protein HOU02_gp208 [Caulobacter phage CcrBL9]AXQ69517.1 hypothetical protein CcrBL9_gp493c [Caulobacter phage CcrBL9]
MPDPKHVLISLVHSILLADNLGDVKEDCDKALMLVGLELPDEIEDDESLREWLATEHGAQHLWSF